MFVKLEECRLDICCSTQISNADPHSQKIFAVDGILLEFRSLDWAAFKGKRSWLEGSWISNEVLTHGSNMNVKIEITLFYLVENRGQFCEAPIVDNCLIIQDSTFKLFKMWIQVS